MSTARAPRIGDVLASGTISGPEREQRGCLMELSRDGAGPPKLPGGVTRTSSEECDEVVLRSELLGDARERIDPVR